MQFWLYLNFYIYIFRNVLNAELLGSALQQFTKEPPSEDNKDIIKPRVEKLDRIRRISTGCMKVDIMSSASSEETPADKTQRTSTTKHVDFLKSKKIITNEWYQMFNLINQYDWCIKLYLTKFLIRKLKNMKMCCINIHLTFNELIFYK